MQTPNPKFWYYKETIFVTQTFLGFKTSLQKLHEIPESLGLRFDNPIDIDVRRIKINPITHRLVL
jgi:hypothetical protein